LDLSRHGGRFFTEITNGGNTCQEHRPPHPQEFRERIVELAQAGCSDSELAREFEPCYGTIRTWIKQANRCRDEHDATTTQWSPDAASAPDLVRWDFQADAPNEFWVEDITYVATAEGFLYVLVVLDAYSRFVVGWAMADHLRTELVLGGLEMTLGQRSPDGVIHHSDQGSQYTSIAFGGAADRPACALYGIMLLRQRAV